MTQEEQELAEQGPQELREQIKTFGWKESAEFIASCIEFVADLCAARKLSLFDIRNFRQGTRIALKILGELQDGPSEEEVRRLREAIDLYNHSLELGRSHDLPDTEPWTLSQAMDWREHVDCARQVCERCCQSWRMMHLDRLSPAHREPALRCIEEIEQHIPLLRSGRLEDVLKQRHAIDKCAILSGQLAGYDDIDTFELYAEAIVDDPKKWAALLEALIDSKWLNSSNPRAYLKTVTASMYHRQVRPDIAGRDSQGFEHRARLGPKVKARDVLGRGLESLSLEEIADRPDEALVERRFTERSISELQKAAEAEPRLAIYIEAIIRNPKWKRKAVWDSLGWDEKVGATVDRQYRRLRGRMVEIGAGMEWRTAPTPGMSEASQTTYFETLLDGKNGARFGLVQHKLLKTQNK